MSSTSSSATLQTISAYKPLAGLFVAPFVQSSVKKVDGAASPVATLSPLPLRQRQGISRASDAPLVTMNSMRNDLNTALEREKERVQEIKDLYKYVTEISAEVLLLTTAVYRNAQLTHILLEGSMAEELKTAPAPDHVRNDLSRDLRATLSHVGHVLQDTQQKILTAIKENTSVQAPPSPVIPEEDISPLSEAVQCANDRIIALLYPEEELVERPLLFSA